MIANKPLLPKARIVDVLIVRVRSFEGPSPDLS